MYYETINIDAFPYLLHSDLASYPDALATDGPLITSAVFDAQTFVERFPPIIATINGRNYVVGMRLSLHINLRVLGRATVKVAICSPEECSSDADVARFAKGDRLVHAALIAQLATPTKSRPTMTRQRHLDAKQTCPVCAVYAVGKVQPLVLPLSAGQDWRGVRARGQGGTVHCVRCNFKLHLSNDEFHRFTDFQLPTSQIVATKSINAKPILCPECQKKRRRGIILERQSPDRVVTRCSHCSYGEQIALRTTETPCPTSTSSLNSPSAPASAV